MGAETEPKGPDVIDSAKGVFRPIMGASRFRTSSFATSRPLRGRPVGPPAKRRTAHARRVRPAMRRGRLTERQLATAGLVVMLAGSDRMVDGWTRSEAEAAPRSGGLNRRSVACAEADAGYERLML